MHTQLCFPFIGLISSRAPLFVSSAFGFAFLFFRDLSKRIGVLPIEIKQKFKPL
jgi:hypothetical protein